MYTSDAMHRSVFMSLQEQRTPVDGETYTWLQGTFKGGSRAPYGFWFSGDGRVGLDWSGSGYRDDSLGVRPPVW